MLEKFIENDVMGFERVLRDIEKILLLIDFSDPKRYNFIWKVIARCLSGTSSSIFFHKLFFFYLGGLLYKATF